MCNRTGGGRALLFLSVTEAATLQRRASSATFPGLPSHLVSRSTHAPGAGGPVAGGGRTLQTKKCKSHGWRTTTSLPLFSRHAPRPRPAHTRSAPPPTPPPTTRTHNLLTCSSAFSMMRAAAMSGTVRRARMEGAGPPPARRLGAGGGRSIFPFSKAAPAFQGGVGATGAGEFRQGGEASKRRPWCWPGAGARAGPPVLKKKKKWGE